MNLKRLIPTNGKEKRSKKPDLEEFIKSTEGMAYKKRILKWFQLNLGKPVTSEELARIPGKKGNPISHNIRRVFELRDEEGYDIVNWRDNKTTGLNLKVDEWVLLKMDPDPEKIRPRGVNKRIMFEVFERDGYRCRICGRGRGDDDPFRPGHKIKLHVGHIKAHKRVGGKDVFRVERMEEIKVRKKLTKDDFITMCNVCNEGVKNKDVEILNFADVVEKLSESEQKKIYERLKRKFGRK